MNVIEIDASPRISIVRAKELILAALPTEKYAEVYFYVAANGQPDLEGEHQIKMAEGKFATPYMERDLPEIFEELNIIPRMINLPNMQGFRRGHEILYDISRQEFVLLAEAYNLNVKVSVAELSNGTQENEAAVSAEQRPIQRAAAQNAAILEAIKTNGYVAKSLPKSKPGKSGVKATIRNAVATNSLFQGKVFDKAWERLRSSGEIVDEI
jgi:hypothetical protein